MSYAAGATAGLDSSFVREGSWSFRIARSPDDQAGASASSIHSFMYWVPPLALRGRRVRLRGWVRTEDLEGRALATIQSWAAGRFEVDSAWTGGDSSGKGWRSFEASVVVDSAAHSVVVSVGLAGTGTVWFDGLSLEVGGERVTDLPVATEPTGAELAWLGSHTYAVAGVDPKADGDDADLRPFGDIVGDARVVALGEATHGTSEFFRAKHRLLRYLVETRGFRVFLIEANQLAVERINRYVHGAPGEAADAMRVMFGVWNTEEMRDLIRWMRRYNDAHPGRTVQFVGFDMQNPLAPIDSLAHTMTTFAPELADTLAALYSDYRAAWEAQEYPQAPGDERRVWKEKAQDAYLLVSRAAGRMLGKAASADDSMSVEWAIQNANVVRQAALGAFTQELATRDSAMASNILWTLERRFPQERAVVWAHDAHISEGRDETYNYYRGGSMGGVLSRALGDHYRTVGLLTYAGAYRGYQEGAYLDVPLFPAPAGSLEEALHRIASQRQQQVLLADLRRAASDPEGRWLLEGRPIRLLGYAAEDWGFAYPIAVGNQFDAVLFVDRTTPSRPVRRASAKPAPTG